jgi:hypothetical protein
MRKKLLTVVLIVAALVAVLWLAGNASELVGILKRMHGG